MSALLESNIERDEHMETCAVTSDVQLVKVVSTERGGENIKGNEHRRNEILQWSCAHM